MENNRYVDKIAALVIAVAIFLLGPFFVLAYSDDTTHPALTDETVDFFNLHFSDNAFSDSEKETIKQGSIDEDFLSRPLYHFYDPVYNRGIFGLISSKQWAKATLEQAGFASIGAGSLKEYFSGNKDFSWERAIYEYAWRDKNRGLKTLGHILHLIQDASVPDHTRNDPHPPFFDALFEQASPYEGWTKKFDVENIAVFSKLHREKPAILSSLDEYFDNLAIYSNNNFFSKDTTPDKNTVYNLPTEGRIIEEHLSSGDIATFILSKRIDNYRLARIKTDIITDTKTYFLEDIDNLVLSDYWLRLSKQAVLHGAGVIKLFFDEVEKEKETKILYNKNKSWFQKVFDETKNAIFNVASIFYGSSITPVDLEDDLEALPPSEQAAAVAAPVAPQEPAEQTSILLPAAEREVGPPTEDLATIPEDLAVKPPSGAETGLDTDVRRLEEGFRDQYGLVALPPGGGAIGGGGSPPSAPSLPPDTTPPGPPIITTPSDFSQTFTQNTINFSGTSENDAAITQNFDNTSTTTLNGSWSLGLVLNQGTTTIQFFATDEAGNQSQATEITLFVDSIGPDLSFEITECGNSLSAGCLSTSTTAALSWSSEAQDLVSYELNCQANGAPCADFPKTFSATSSIQLTEALSDFTFYIFSVKATDQAGNQTQISRTIERASLPVVINEIAWMGTASSTADEWLELKNNSGQAINFSGSWVLRADDNTPYIILTGSISAGGYYLLERKDDLTVSDTAADQPPYGNDGPSWALNNNGEHLFLERVASGATTTIDEVPLCGFFPSWCAGDNTSKKTMERYDPLAAGTSAANWGTALGEFILNGTDASGVSIKGTPKAKNSISYQIANSSQLNADKTLTKDKSPYLIGRNGFTINSGAVLTLEAGAVVKLVSPNEPSLVVNGTIQSNGTANEPVVFTSFSDDTYGGDMNNDGICNPQDASSTAACPAPGSWMQILINSTSQNSEFSNTIIRYGGRWFNNMEMRSAVAVDGSNVSFASTNVEYSKKHGLYLKLSSSQITSSTFSNNGDGQDSNLDAAGIYVAGGSPNITASTFSNNRYGIYAANADLATVSANMLNNNAVESIHIDGRIGSFSANSGAGNGLNAIVLGDNSNIISAGTTTLAANDLPYLIKREARVPSGSILTFSPGVVIKGHDNNAGAAGKLVVKGGGKLYFDGTSESDLIFTSMYDNSFGGNITGTSSAPQPGDWLGIFVESGGVIDMRGFTLRYAGGLTIQGGDNKAGIKIDGGLGLIDAAVIENNNQNGLRLSDSGSVIIKNTTIRNHVTKQVDQAVGILVLDSSAELENITFENNELDIKADGDYSVDCLNCGSPTTDPDPL